MLDSSRGTTLVWCVVLCIEFCLIASTPQAIYCTTDNTIDTKCTCQEVKQVNWSSDDEEPAPRPFNMTLTLLRYTPGEKKDCVRVSVSWTQRASHFKSNYVTGYYLEATVGHMIAPKYFECSTKDITASSDMVSFIFNDTAIFSWCPIPRGEEITYTINPRPIYTNGSNPSWIEQQIYANIRKDPPPNSPQTVSSSTDVDRQSTTTEPSSTFSWHIYLVSAFIIALGIVLVLLTCRICRKILQKEVELKRILVIANRNDKTSIDAYHKVIRVLKQCGNGNIEIETNIQKTNEIGKEGISDWMSEKIRSVDVVILIVISTDDYVLSNQACRSDHTKNDDSSQVAIAMRVAQIHMLKRSENSTKFLAFYSHVRPDVNFCQCYNMEKERKKFFKQALGSLYKARLISEAFTTTENDTNPMMEDNSIINFPSTSQNDLNWSSHFPTNYTTSTLNDIAVSTGNYNSPQSIENNEMV